MGGGNRVNFFFLGSGGKRWVAHRPWVQVSMACFCVAEQEVSQRAARPNLPGKKKKKNENQKNFPGAGIYLSLLLFLLHCRLFSPAGRRLLFASSKSMQAGGKRRVCVPM